MLQKNNGCTSNSSAAPLLKYVHGLVEHRVTNKEVTIN